MAAFQLQRLLPWVALIALGVCVVAATTRAARVRPVHPGFDNRWVSFWLKADPINLTDNALYLDEIRAQGGNRVMTSMTVYCDDRIDDTGTFQPSTTPGCKYFVDGLAAMGIGADTIIGASLGGWKAAVNNPNLSIPAIVERLAGSNLTGVSFDPEHPDEKIEQADKWHAWLSSLRAAIAPMGARLTSYSDRAYKFIDNVPRLVGHVDRCLCGQTYRGGESFGYWNHSLDSVLRGVGNHSRIGVGMITEPSNKNGYWNCKAGSFHPRVEAVLASGCGEIAIFSLARGPGRCTASWFEPLRAYLNGTTQFDRARRRAQL